MAKDHTYEGESRRRSRTKVSGLVGAKELRKLRARSVKREVWFGLGMFGVVGWSVGMPTLGGVAVGLWIDSQWPGQYSWTLTLLVLGVVVGCLQAWFWISREQKRIRHTEENEEAEDDGDGS